MKTSKLGNFSIAANPVAVRSAPNSAADPLAVNIFYVPCVPISVCANLVTAQPLAKQLAASVASSSPELVNLSHADFSNIQIKKSELRRKIDVCAMTDEALLDVCLLNVGDLFANLMAHLMALGQFAESGEGKAHFHAQVSLQLVNDHATAMGLAVSDYCVSGVINPEMLLDACLKRVLLLQKRWQDNYFLSIELALQLQRDAVYGTAASCLSEICQYGLDNQISLDPTPQSQEDVLVALATFVDEPFSGEWPVLRERVIVLENEGGKQ